VAGMRARRRWVRLVLSGLARLLLGSSFLIGALGWFAAGRFLEPRRTSPNYDVRVIDVAEGRVRLERTEESEKPGVWGLEWEGGYAQVSRIFRLERSTVLREYRPFRGTLEVGLQVSVDRWAYPGDPETAFGMAFANVDVPSALGDFPAWYVGGSRDTWVIFVHGMNASRREALRMLPGVVDLDFPSLVVTYRNDPGAPASPDGMLHLGETEWQDVESAATFALDHGAEHLVMVGFSMGGSIVAQFLQHSPSAGRVEGAILDAPALDWGSTVTLVGEGRGLPAILTSAAKAIFSIRFEEDWRNLDEVDVLDPLDVPILLFHGIADDTVPIETSDGFAVSERDRVTYVRVPGAGHVEAWNLDRAAYGAAVRAFLVRVTK